MLVYNAHGRHSKVKLICGDLNIALDGEGEFDAIFTSPPYNIGSKGKKRGCDRRRLGLYNTRDWSGITGYADNLPEEEYQRGQKKLLDFLLQRSTKNAVFGYNHKDRHKKGKLITPELWLPGDWILHDKIVWDRGSTLNHSPRFYYPEYEYVYILKKNLKTPKFKNYSKLGSVIELSRAKQEKGNEHCAAFPLELPSIFIQDFGERGCLVCDPHSGSGTTLLAAYQQGCNFIGAELMEGYFRNSIKFFEKKTGVKGTITDTNNRCIVAA